MIRTVLATWLILLSNMLIAGRVEIDLPIMMDKAGNAVKDWSVYAYPSTFLIDKNGQIKFAYHGALDWDSVSIVKMINRLL